MGGVVCGTIESEYGLDYDPMRYRAREEEQPQYQVSIN